MSDQEEYIWDAIKRERARQRHEKAYTAGHDDEHSRAQWCAILQHELGGVADAALNEIANPPEWTISHYERSLEKLAAVAVAAIAALHRTTDRAAAAEIAEGDDA